MIKDLEHEKVRYQVTPRKSLSFTEDKENHRFPYGYSPYRTDLQERDKTFQLDHLRDSGNIDPSSRRSAQKYKISSEPLRESQLKESIGQPPLASSKLDKPPVSRPTNILTENNNKLKLREKLKKLKLTKQELASIVKDIEIEKYKATELKNSLFNDIRKVFI